MPNWKAMERETTGPEHLPYLAEGREAVAVRRGTLVHPRRDEPEERPEHDRRGREPDVRRTPRARCRRENSGEGWGGEEREVAARDVDPHRRAAHAR